MIQTHNNLLGNYMNIAKATTKILVNFALLITITHSTSHAMKQKQLKEKPPVSLSKNACPEKFLQYLLDGDNKKIDLFFNKHACCSASCCLHGDIKKTQKAIDRCKKHSCCLHGGFHDFNNFLDHDIIAYSHTTPEKKFSGFWGLRLPNSLQNSFSTIKNIAVLCKIFSIKIDRSLFIDILHNKHLNPMDEKVIKRVDCFCQLRGLKDFGTSKKRYRISCINIPPLALAILLGKYKTAMLLVDKDPTLSLDILSREFSIFVFDCKDNLTKDENIFVDKLNAFTTTKEVRNVVESMKEDAYDFYTKIGSCFNKLERSYCNISIKYMLDNLLTKRYQTIFEGIDADIFDACCKK